MKIFISYSREEVKSGTVAAGFTPTTFGHVRAGIAAGTGSMPFVHRAAPPKGTHPPKKRRTADPGSGSPSRPGHQPRPWAPSEPDPEPSGPRVHGASREATSAR